MAMRQMNMEEAADGDDDDDDDDDGNYVKFTRVKRLSCRWVADATAAYATE